MGVAGSRLRLALWPLALLPGDGCARRFVAGYSRPVSCGDCLGTALAPFVVVAHVTFCPGDLALGSDSAPGAFAAELRARCGRLENCFYDSDLQHIAPCRCIFRCKVLQKGRRCKDGRPEEFGIAKRLTSSAEHLGKPNLPMPWLRS